MRLIAVLCCLVAPVHAWDTVTIDKVITTLRQCSNIPAITIGVVQLDDHDQVNNSYAQGYGFQYPTCQATSCPEVDATTRFCIGSCSKAFTGSILGAVLAASKYNQTMWDTPLVNILPAPQANFFNTDPIHTKITIRDILSHRMGIERNDAPWLFDIGLPRERILSNAYTLNAIGPLEQVWRSSFHYNNWMVALGGHVAEFLTGKSWESLVEEYYYKPLNMNMSEFYHINYATGTNYAKMGVVINKEWTNDTRPLGYFNYLEPIAAAGGVCSNANDMIKYMSFLLKTTESSTDKISRQVLNDAMSASNSVDGFVPTLSLPMRPIGSSMDTYGFGWFQGLYRGYSSVQHQGDIDGFDSNVFLLPTEKLGVFVSVASDLHTPVPLAAVISYSIADVVLGLPMWLNLTTACAAPIPPVLPTVPPGSPNCTLESKTYAVLAGTYTHPMFGYFNITWDATKSQLSWAMGNYGLGIFCSWPEAAQNTYKLYVSITTSFLSYNTADYRNLYYSDASATFVMDSAKRQANSIILTAMEAQGSPVYTNVNTDVSSPSPTVSKAPVTVPTPTVSKAPITVPHAASTTTAASFLLTCFSLLSAYIS